MNEKVIEGQITDTRGFKRICFVDLLVDGKLVEVIVKGNVDAVRSVKKTLNRGDVIKVFGYYEENNKTRDHDIFICSRFEVMRKWEKHKLFEPPENAVFVSEKSQKNKMCKFFVSTQTCPKGIHCPYAHITNGTKRHEWVLERRRLRRERGGMDGDTLDVHDKKNKKMRASVFAKFLIETFGDSNILSKGCGVLDVAGGRREMNFELNVLRNVRCTTIDPRPSKLSKRQLRWLKRKNRASRKRLEAGEKTSIQEETSSQLLKRMRRIQAMFDPAFVDSEYDLVKNCTLIIGMHPDEATEEIVDMALHLKKPFAVVPCCVFPKSGEKMSCEKWHEYLKSKSPHIREKYLNFVGRNQVLYYKPGGISDDPFPGATPI